MTDCREVENSGNKIRTKFLTRYIWPHWLRGLWSGLTAVKKNKIEIIFTPNILPLGSIAYILNKLLGLPYIISLHGLDINLALKNKSQWSKKILANAKMVVCNTKYTAGLIKDLVPIEKVIVIYPSISISHEKASKEQISALKKKHKITDEKIILAVGRLVARKGQDLVIEALAKKNHLNCKYLIVGDGPYKKSLEDKIKENNLSEKVILSGKVEAGDLPIYYQLADLFVMPHQEKNADIEGFGIVFLEAASFHLPIIAGRSGGVKELFSGQGEVYFAENSEEVLKGLEDLLSDQQKAADFGQSAFLVSQRFRNIETENIKLFEKILS